jgi:hypothetical protein
VVGVLCIVGCLCISGFVLARRKHENKPVTKAHNQKSVSEPRIWDASLAYPGRRDSNSPCRKKIAESEYDIQITLTTTSGK